MKDYETPPPPVELKPGEVARFTLNASPFGTVEVQQNADGELSIRSGGTRLYIRPAAANLIYVTTESAR